MRDSFGLRNVTHDPILRQEMPSLAVGKGKSKGIHKAQGRSLGLIGDRYFNGLRVQRFNSQPEIKQVLSAVSTKVDQFLMEQQVRHCELKLQIEHLVQELPL